MLLKNGIWSMIFSAYFFLNILMILSYPILRLFTEAGKRDLRHEDNFGFTYQNSIIYTVLTLAVLAYTRSSSLSMFISDGLTLGKIGVICLLVFAEFNFALLYFLICIITWLVIPYPRFYARNKFIKIENEEQFNDLVGEQIDSDQQQQLLKKTNRKKLQRHQQKIKQQQQSQQIYQYKNKEMFFIEFYADWVLNCQFAKQLWYEYSNKYTTSNLKFLSINVDKFPDLAKRFRINTSGFSKQLPTIVIVEDGQETLRFPPIDKKTNKIEKISKLDYKILLRFFDLESRFLETRE